MSWQSRPSLDSRRIPSKRRITDPGNRPHTIKGFAVFFVIGSGPFLNPFRRAAASRQSHDEKDGKTRTDQP